MSIDMIEPLTLGQEVNAPRQPTETIAQSSASKALALLEAISKARGNSFGVTEVAADIGVPKSTAHRLLKTLEEHGFVGRTGSRYRVGGSFFELSEAARWSEFGELRDVAPGPLNWLFERSNADAVHLATLSGRDVLYLDKITRPAGTRLPSRVGGRFPATCTALGKAILAHSPRATVVYVIGQPLTRVTPYSVSLRKQFVDQLGKAQTEGYAIEREEACHGTICVAAPVLHAGVAIAAVSLSVPTAIVMRVGDTDLGALGRLAVDAAARIAHLLPLD
ncbi:IclR family transcriptional regulator (plasmid) [Rhodococcus erythropolis]|uniref:IclR family transcriptional regulator n=1 Tax=Rhodococcus baikonurensis TaxID=172041 RepID=A0ABV5XPT0_9NOCA|nr:MULTISPECIES: IclR family transcriptional regulator [Rhodococcus]MCJ0949858.1 IclR family transcriptional regulator [Rhodococcus sp. ARC_M8]MCQ4152146.1 IclR family transcriptional regulator [Rhodococcus qingshengii]MDJ0441272.1 IclR family transcriptional regulator [Rhodococcus qingshengii]QEX08476.1 IclR family transcriptional regulator [Rhodococcus erythropolis]